MDFELDQNERERIFQKNLLFQNEQKKLQAKMAALQKKPQMFGLHNFRTFMQDTRNFITNQSKIQNQTIQRPKNRVLDKFNSTQDKTMCFNALVNGNSIISGKSWDCDHLEKFMNTSIFGQPIQQNLNKTHSMTQNQYKNLKKYGKILDFSSNNIINVRGQQCQNILKEIPINQEQSVQNEQEKSKQNSQQIQNISSMSINLQGEQILNNDETNKQPFADVSSFQRCSALGQGHKTVNKEWRNTNNASLSFLGPKKFTKSSIYQNPSDFLSNYENVNYWVTKIPCKLEEIDKNFINQCKFQVISKKHDIEKLNFNQTFGSSEEHLKQLLETKKNQIKLSEWKKDYLARNKKYRIIKNQYRSGILSVDNPQFRNSLFYQEEAKDYFNRLQEKLRMKDKMRKFIQEHNKTNADISFFNKNALQLQSQQQIQNGSQVNKQYYGPFWQAKTRSLQFYNNVQNLICQGSQTIKDQQKFQNSFAYTNNNNNSQDRLFGKEKVNYSYERALNLYNNETKGRNFNILSQCSQQLILPKKEKE